MFLSREKRQARPITTCAAKKVTRAQTGCATDMNAGRGGEEVFGETRDRQPAGERVAELLGRGSGFLRFPLGDDVRTSSRSTVHRSPATELI